MKEIETLERGLANLRHPALLERGELQLALDAEYIPGDIGLTVAAGREKLGTAADPVNPEPIKHAQFIEWDAPLAGDPRLREIAYVSPLTPTALSTVPAKALANDPAFDSPSTFGNVEWGPSPMRAVYQGGEWFFLTGHALTNQYLTRRFVPSGGAPALQTHGMRANKVPVRARTGPAGTGTFPKANYAYWFTWYRPGYDLEGEFIPDDPTYNFTDYPLPTGLGTADVYASAASTNASIRVIANKSAVDGNKPAWATHLRLYRAQSDYNLNWNTNTRSPYFPFGFLLLEIEYTALTTVIDAGLPTEAYVLYDDNFGVTYDALGFRPPYPYITVDGTPFSWKVMPPRASTGCIYEESLVMNDMDDRQSIVYSVENDPFGFPLPYRLRFDTSAYDEVLRVETVGRTLVVGLRESVWRVNWLPRDTDSGFDKGVVKEQIAGAKGLVNAQAACTFDHPDLGPLFAWCARDGLYITDGDRVVWVTAGIDWKKLVSNVTSTVVLNNPDRKRLEVGVQTGDSGVDAWLYVTYDNGTRITGPVRRPGEVHAFALGVLEDGSQGILSTDQKGRLYYEGRGTTDASTGQTMALAVKTREVYSAGMSEVFEATRLFLHSDGPGNVGASYALEGGGVSATRTIGPDTADPLSTKIKPMRGERMTVTITGVGEGERVNFVGWDWDPQDVER